MVAAGSELTELLAGEADLGCVELSVELRFDLRLAKCSEIKRTSAGLADGSLEGGFGIFSEVEVGLDVVVVVVL